MVSDAAFARTVDIARPDDILGDIAGDTSANKRDRASRLLLKAIRSLPEREQDAVLVYLLDRSFAPAPPTTSHDYTRTLSFRPSLTAAFPGAQMRVGLSEGSGRRDAALILHRLAEVARIVVEL